MKKIYSYFLFVLLLSAFSWFASGSLTSSLISTLTLLLCCLTGSKLLELFGVRSFDHGFLILSCVSGMAVAGIAYQIHILASLIILIGSSTWYLLSNRNTLTEKWNFCSADFMLSFLLAFAFLFTGNDYREALSAFVTQPVRTDTYYFSALTQSLSESSYFDLYLEKGTTLNYQFLSFLFPAFLKYFSGYNAHQAMWAFAMPVYKILGITGFAFCSSRLFQFSTGHIRFPITIATLLFYTLTSLNPLKIIPFQPEAFILLGPGNFLPGGNPPLSFAFIFLPFLFIHLQEKNLRGLALSLTLSTLILLSKIALWFPAMVVCCLYWAFTSIIKRNWILLLYPVIVICGNLLFYYLFYTDRSGVSVELEPFSYLKIYSEQLAHQQNIPVAKAILIFVMYLLLSAGIRLLFIAYGLIKTTQNIKIKLWAAIGGVIASTLPILCLRIYFRHVDGNIATDGSFDLEQFIRSGFIQFHFWSVAIVLYCMYQLPEKWLNVSLSIIAVYTSMVTYSYFAYQSMLYANYKPLKNEWREVLRLKPVEKDALYCIAGNSELCNAHLLAADGIGPWWYSGRRNDGSRTYFQTCYNTYRWALIDSVMTGSYPDVAIQKMKDEQVTHIIATPDAVERLSTLTQRGYLSKTRTPYLFQIP